jgi:hypothetical protein
MKPAFSLLVFVLGALVASAQTTTPVAPAAPTQPTLGVIVVDSLPHRHGYDAFNLIDEEFSNVFAARQWPVKVTFERFAANNDQYPIELKIFDEGIRNEFTERRIRAWVILTVNGTKHDFGIVDFLYSPGPAERVDDIIHRMYRTEGQKVADLIQPFLVPAPVKQ